MYRRIGELSIDSGKAFGCDSIVVDIDDSMSPLCLRISLFKGEHFQDETFVELSENEHKDICTDADYWKKRCLELAAQLTEMEEEPDETDS